MKPILFEKKYSKHFFVFNSISFLWSEKKSSKKTFNFGLVISVFLYNFAIEFFFQKISPLTLNSKLEYFEFLNSSILCFAKKIKYFLKFYYYKCYYF